MGWELGAGGIAGTKKHSIAVRTGGALARQIEDTTNSIAVVHWGGVGGGGGGRGRGSRDHICLSLNSGAVSTFELKKWRGNSGAVSTFELKRWRSLHLSAHKVAHPIAVIDREYN